MKIDKTSMFWQLSWKVAVLCLITFIVGCFFTKPLVWGAGVLLGFLFTIVRLKWMDIMVQKAVEKGEGASRYVTGQYFLRYLLSIGVLAIAALVPWINLYATMIAMFTLKIATYIQGFFEKKAPKDGSVQFNEWVDEEEEEEEDWDRWETYNLKARKKKARQEQKSIRRADAGRADTQQAENLVQNPEPEEQLSLDSFPEMEEEIPDEPKEMDGQMSLFDD